LALLLYAGTLFCSAFLLFLVQPIIGQKILPKLGGTPSVWNTCVVFFQLALLIGYAYTHFTTKLPVRRQILIHCALLFVPFLILLPYGPFPIEWYSNMFVTGGNPMLPTLFLLAVIVGIPFFVVSTTAPLLQKWFGSTGHPAAKDPYFLYGASNFGSMLSLLLYPTVFEPIFGLEGQSWFYTIGYMALVGLVIACALMVFASPASAPARGKKADVDVEKVPSFAPEPPPEPMAAAAQATTEPSAPATSAVTSAPPAPSPAPALAPRPTAATGIKKGGKKGKGRDLAKMAPAAAVTESPMPTRSVGTPQPAPAPAPSIAKPGLADPDEITWPRRLRWIGLAAVPSSLMLGVTTYMSTDISAIPLFWVVPLALYLLSFILVFMRWPINWLEKAHDYVLYLQPALLALLVLFITISGVGAFIYPTTFMLLAFTATALACHGELAKDRPSAKHLTEFYLLMSVGGAVGGLFNGIIAPFAFKKFGVVEFGLALVIAGLLRPALMEIGWVEWLIGKFTGAGEVGHSRGKGGKKVARAAAAEGPPTLLFDIGIPLALLALLGVLLWTITPRGLSFTRDMFMCIVIPLFFAATFFERPLRFGLTLGAVLLLTGIYQNRGGSVLFQTRSYFGVLRVREGGETYGNQVIPYTNLTHGTTDHGMALKSTKEVDLSRVATTYYHRQGPAGICMERFNWFPKDYDITTFSADARIPAALVGLGTPSLGVSLPMDQLVGAWSEPAFCVIGMGTATMSSYARPYQFCHFYEIDEQIRLLSLPEGAGLTYYEIQDQVRRKALPTDDTYFGYVHAALKRGGNVQVLMGDARLRMAMPWAPDEKAYPVVKGMPTWEISKDHFDKRGGPEYFYHLMVVDAFSSDAIPRHLITKEAMEMYMRHLVQGHWGPWIDVNPSEPSEDLQGNRIDSIPAKFYWEESRQGSNLKKRAWYPGGVLCVHTSNRHLELKLVVADTADKAEWDDLYDRDANGVPKKKTGLVAKRGHDQAPGRKYLDRADDIGHYNSEWIMVARDEKDLKHLRAPPKYNEWMRLAHDKNPREVPEYAEYWTSQSPRGPFVWTDNYSNLMAVFRWSSRGGD
jgi:hypothetical protein